MKRTILAAIASLGLLLPSAGQALECLEIAERLDRAIPPEVGDPAVVERLLNPRVASPQLSESFSLVRAALAVRDPSLFLPKTSCEEEEHMTPRHGSSSGAAHQAVFGHLPKPRRGAPRDCTHWSKSGKQLRERGSEGRYAYLNPDRSHRGFTQNGVSQADAAEATLRALLVLGVPRSEIDPRGVETRDLVLMAQALGSGAQLGEKRTARAEVHVLYPRQVEGTPVFDSFGRAAIDAKGEVARLHVNWPDFCIPESARSRSARSRSEIIAEALATIQNAGPCQEIGAVGAGLVYAHLPALKDRSGVSAEDDDSAAGDDGECYVPAVLVTAVGRPEQEEDLALAGQILTLPLIGDARDPGGSAP
jgi:hypothetical protein